MKKNKVSKSNDDQDEHYEKIKIFFKRDAENKCGFYDDKDSETVPKKLEKRMMWKVYTKCLNEILKDNPVLTSVLDAGCGMGNFTLELSNHDNFKTIVGIDFIKETFDIALKNAEKFPRVSFLQADILKIPFENRSFDLVFCLNVLHHIHPNDFKKAIHELSRITDKYLVFEIRNKKCVFDLLYNYLLVPYRYNGLPVYSSSIKTVCDFLKEYGFDLLSIEGENSTSFICRRLVLVFKRN